MNLSSASLRANRLRATAQAELRQVIKLGPVLSSVHGTFSSCKRQPGLSLNKLNRLHENNPEPRSFAGH